ncbi:hypothetical protein [Siphonobacter sp. SORGH_AS_1065]|uniref:hypothetical protein n=1 Tax=Siphonobacter sp. SORGH_AS_1065 TaxID=3041795 RepID=UPI002780E9D3|nr:hypothetical protein [Siphonobacter sp. SORGH_AS_1065]MDQ1090421.1 hypothetical protein [Siphonobacter sp. SORGH_AS_1065]
MSPLFKSISVVFFTGLLLLRTLMVPLILMDFELRHDYIASELCVNRDKPQLHCDGKCYLAKKLKAAQDSEEKEASGRLLSQLLEVPAQLTQTHITFHCPTVSSEPINSTFTYLCFFPSSLPTDIFRPPQLG